LKSVDGCDIIEFTEYIKTKPQRLSQDFRTAKSNNNKLVVQEYPDQPPTDDEAHTDDDVPTDECGSVFSDASSIDETKKNQKIIDLINIITIDKKDRIAWIKICSCMKYNNLTNDDWLLFCTNNSLNMDKEKLEIFKKIDPHPIEIYYLQSLAKNSDLNKYKLWLEKYNVYYIDALDLEDPYKTAVTISKTLKSSLVLCSENWYMVNETQLWQKQKEPSFYIINELRKYIDVSNKKLVEKIEQTDDKETQDKLIEISKIYLKSYKTISNSSFLNVLTKYLKTLLNNSTFVQTLDANKGFLAFKNGIMNLETKTFRKGILSTDFITETIPFNYKKGDETKLKFVKDVLLKILNNNVEHLEYFLSLIGYTFIGVPNLEKSIYFCVDKTSQSNGDNGKTFFFDILTTLFPNYVYKSKGTFLEEGNTKIHKQLVQMKGKRLVWLDEFGKKKTNAELMKVVVECNYGFEGFKSESYRNLKLKKYKKKDSHSNFINLLI
jgi:hypothetical protein